MVKKILLVAVLTLCASFSATAGVEYPDELASEFPLHSGCTAFQSTKMEKGLIVTVQCDSATIDALFQFYKKKATAAGYKIAMTTQQDSNMMFMAQKGARNVAVSVTRGTGDDGGILVSFTVIDR